MVCMPKLKLKSFIPSGIRRIVRNVRQRIQDLVTPPRPQNLEQSRQRSPPPEPNLTRNRPPVYPQNRPTRNPQNRLPVRPQNRPADPPENPNLTTSPQPDNAPAIISPTPLPLYDPLSIQDTIPIAEQRVHPNHSLINIKALIQPFDARFSHFRYMDDSGTGDYSIEENKGEIEDIDKCRDHNCIIGVRPEEKDIALDPTLLICCDAGINCECPAKTLACCEGKQKICEHCYGRQVNAKAKFTDHNSLATMKCGHCLRTIVVSATDCTKYWKSPKMIRHYREDDSSL